MEEGSNEKEKKLFDLEGYTTKHATYITHTHTYRKRETAMGGKKRDWESEIVIEKKKKETEVFLQV